MRYIAHPRIGRTRPAKCSEETNIFDASDGKFSTLLNTTTVQGMVRECYGDIRHPTIDEIVHMVMDFARDKQQELGEGFR